MMIATTVSGPLNGTGLMETMVITGDLDQVVVAAMAPILGPAKR